MSKLRDLGLSFRTMTAYKALLASMFNALSAGNHARWLYGHA